jgi:hypothetical protein
LHEKKYDAVAARQCCAAGDAGWVQENKALLRPHLSNAQFI